MWASPPPGSGWWDEATMHKNCGCSVREGAGPCGGRAQGLAMLLPPTLLRTCT